MPTTHEFSLLGIHRSYDAHLGYHHPYNRMVRAEGRDFAR